MNENISPGLFLFFSDCNFFLFTKNKYNNELSLKPGKCNDQKNLNNTCLQNLSICSDFSKLKKNFKKKTIKIFNE